MKRITLKNVEFSERMSEETNAFVADVYLDGRKFATAKNNGRGGQTDIMPYGGKKELLKEATEYVVTLPKHKIGKDSYHLDLEFVVDILLEDYLELKSIKKYMTNGLVIRNKDGVLMHTKFKKSITVIRKLPGGEKFLKDKIAKHKKDGYEILNTNLVGLL